MQGKFVVDTKKLAIFKKKILAVDSNAWFDPTDVRLVRHSGCGKVYMAPEAYSASRIVAHMKSCCRKGRAAGMQTLEAMQAQKKWSTKKSGKNVIVSTSWPCLRITVEAFPTVGDYLLRSGAPGGGSRSITKISQQIYGQRFSCLETREFSVVLTQQSNENSWRNDHANMHVFATVCRQTVRIAEGEPQVMCSTCATVMASKAFKKVTGVSTLVAQNYVYNNGCFQTSELGCLYAKCTGLQELIQEKAIDSVPMRFAWKALSGAFKDSAVFMGMVEAMTVSAEWTSSGHGSQNFKYPPMYDDFCHLVQLTSPVAYQHFCAHFRACSTRSFQQHHAAGPWFPIGITEQTFIQAEKYVMDLQYTEYLALSCDDTKLLASLCMYLDHNKNQWFLVGSTGELFAVADPEALRQILNTVQMDNLKAPKATKRTKIPLPSVPPLVLAAKAISGSLKADQLLAYMKSILDGCWVHGLHIISYLCDGTEVECSVQRMLIESAMSVIPYCFPHSDPNLPPLVVPISFFGDKPLVTIQDSKHALKTLRNNSFTSAHALILGSHLVTYGTICELAYTEGSPLYHHDVDKLDRQDDNVASHLFSASTLKFLTQQKLQELGQIIYLFNCYYVSCECNDILHILIHGLIGLIIVHRDFPANDTVTFPLLPWLHSMEACEHVFDFTYLDFLYMILKLSVVLKAVVLAPPADAKTWAAGYIHTYFNTRDIDLTLLSEYPSDTEITAAAQEGYEEAPSLFAYLGVHPDLFTSSSIPAQLPSIHSILATLLDHNDSSDEDQDMWENESLGEGAILQDLIENCTDPTVGNHAECEHLYMLTFTAISATVDDTIHM
ncbi:hypothetical protein K439DRAFT_1623403 [Ramaria rubella]|nr:hypothetical protein K439DRAFT_1623403 [Ramaria rubella]